MNKNGFGLTASIIFLLIFFVIVLLPLVLILAESVLSRDAIRSLTAFDARQLTLLKNSMCIGIGTLAFSAFLGIPYAFFIARTNLPVKGLFFIASFLPFFLPPHITAIGWLKLLGTAGLGLPLAIYGVHGVIFILGLSFFPFITFLTVSGLSSLDPRLEEAGALTCAKKDVIRRITLPLLVPYLFAGAVFVFIFAVSDYGVADLLRVNTYPVEISAQFSAFYNTPKAVVLALPLMGITLFLILLQRRFMGKKSYVTISCDNNNRHVLILLGRAKIIAVFFCSAVIFFSVIVPVGMLVIGAGPLPVCLKIRLRPDL